jgi:uncharacterized protein YcbX
MLCVGPRRRIMTTLGTIAQIWRYPVKSMAGEQLERCPIGPGGLVGDRGWAVRDEQAGEIRGAKQLPKLLRCAARYLEEPQGREVPHVEITLSDGSTVRSDEDDADERLSKFLGRPVTLWSLQPAADDEHYRRSQPLSSEAVLRDFLSREEEESLPDLSSLDPTLVKEIVEFTSPRGTYFDVSPYHLLTTASLEALQALLPDARLDVRRFRPNLYIQTPPGIEGFVEFDWTGKALRVGEALLTAGVPVPRCGMTAAAQRDLSKDPSILRAIVREVKQVLGIYGSTDSSGVIQEGDIVRQA